MTIILAKATDRVLLSSLKCGDVFSFANCVHTKQGHTITTSAIFMVCEYTAHPNKVWVSCVNFQNGLIYEFRGDEVEIIKHNATLTVS